MNSYINKSRFVSVDVLSMFSSCNLWCPIEVVYLVEPVKNRYEIPIDCWFTKMLKREHGLWMERSFIIENNLRLEYYDAPLSWWPAGLFEKTVEDARVMLLKQLEDLREYHPIRIVTPFITYREELSRFQ